MTVDSSSPKPVEAARSAATSGLVSTRNSRLENGTSLTHPGSLYIGSGLGMRKTAKVSDAMSGSTKHMIKTILARRKEEEERALFADDG